MKNWCDASQVTTSVQLAGLVVLLVVANNLSAQNATERHPEVPRVTTLGVDYSHVSFQQDFDPWNFASVSLGRRTGRGSLIGRVNYANRFGSSGSQVEVDAYPRLTRSTYAYLSVGYSASGIFPAWRSGGELFTSLPRAWEASLGYRQLRFGGAPVTLFTGAVGKYVGDYWFSLRRTCTPPGAAPRLLRTSPRAATLLTETTSRAHLSVSDLSLGDLWLLSVGHCLRTQVVTLCQQRGGRRRSATSANGDACTRVARFESDNLETLKRLVERGSGMTLLPALAVADLATAAQRRLVVPFGAPVPIRGVTLIRRRTHFRQHLVTAVVEIVQEVANAALSGKPSRP